MKQIGKFLTTGASLLISLQVIHARPIVPPTQTYVAISDDDLSAMVQVLQQTPPLPSDSIPPIGTFYSAQDPNQPPLPFNASGLPGWSLGDGLFLLDDRGVDSSSCLLSSDVFMSTLDGPPPLGDGVDGDGSGSSGGSSFTYSINTNGLWLEITNMANGYVSGVVHNLTNSVYAILGSTNLLDINWSIEQSIRPDVSQTTAPFTANTLDRQILFLRAMDWTSVDANANGMLDYWEYENFGDFNQTAEGDYDGDGISNLAEFQLNSDPNTIDFSLILGTGYFNTTNPTVQCQILKGTPAFGSGVSTPTLSRDSHFPDGLWLPYNGVVLPLGETDGVYQIKVGLKGRSPDSQPTWVVTTAILDRVAPKIEITTPLPGAVAKPYLQIRGWADEQLSGVTCLISNSAGIFPYPEAFVGGCSGKGTNNFSCLDVPLTNGLNTVILTARDLAGNQTTTNLNFTLDYSSNTNPPVLQLTWPQSGANLCGDKFTIRGKVDDETGGISVSGSALAEPITGIIERDGNFWIENLPLSDGINDFTLFATNSAGHSTQILLSVIKSSVQVTINDIPVDQLGQTSIDVSGTISASGYSVELNGVSATVNGNTWLATNVPVSPNGTTVFSAVAQLAAPGSNPPVQTEKVIEKKPSFEIAWTRYDSSGALDYWFWNVGDVLFKTTAYSHFEWWGKGGYFETGGTGDYGLYGDGSPETSVRQTSYDANRNIISGTLAFPSSLMRKVKGGLTFEWQMPWDEYQLQTDYQDVRFTLKTGGKSTVKRKSLFALHGTATEIRPPWDPWYPYTAKQAIGRRDIDPITLTVGDLGHPDANGMLYKILNDNEEYNVTVEANAPCYQFDVTADKYMLEHATACTAAANPDDSRLKIGIGEIVNLWGMPANTTWRVVGGGTLSSANGSGTVFTASKNPTPSIMIYAKAWGQELSVELSAVAPDGFETTIESSPGLGLLLGTNEIGQLTSFNVDVTPKTVSFKNVSFREYFPNDDSWTWPNGEFVEYRNRPPWPWRVNCDNRNPDGDLIGSGPYSKSKLFNGTNYVDFSTVINWQEQYLNEEETWVTFVKDESRTVNYRASDFKAKVTNRGVEGVWQGPWQ